MRMSRETPQAAFEHAQAAMLRGDLFEVFACLDVNDLKRVAANAESAGRHEARPSRVVEPTRVSCRARRLQSTCERRRIDQHAPVSE